MKFAFGQSVQVEPDHTEAFRLNKVIGGHEGFFDIATAPHPQQILKLYTSEMSRARIKTAARINHRTNLPRGCEFCEQREHQAGFTRSGAASYLGQRAPIERQTKILEQDLFRLPFFSF